MKQIIFCFLGVCFTLSILRAQIPIQTSTSKHLKPYKFDAIQNEAVFFQMVISSDDMEEDEMENADFLVFANANNNALFIKSSNIKNWYDISLYDIAKRIQVQKKAVKDVSLLDLSPLNKGTYSLEIRTELRSYQYTIILR